MNMKVPCETIMWEILPCIRKHLALCLIEKHDLSQQQTADLLGVSAAAVSHYVSNKRGRNNRMEPCDEFEQEIRQSADAIANGSNVLVEICKLCRLVQTIQKQKEYDDF